MSWQRLEYLNYDLLVCITVEFGRHRRFGETCCFNRQSRVSYNTVLEWLIGKRRNAKIGQEDRMLTIHGQHHTKAHTDRLYFPRTGRMGTDAVRRSLNSGPFETDWTCGQWRNCTDTNWQTVPSSTAWAMLQIARSLEVDWSRGKRQRTAQGRR
jgi:hypothetical protein